MKKIQVNLDFLFYMELPFGDLKFSDKSQRAW
jgi:hypothetical protein